ncbi:hypothetical protein HDU76_005045 [Blyttiomyces sp. JEL0837]|nr:hypothetical protein HDU76_005045 [Blyttiomyces sp. JEL0837]
MQSSQGPRCIQTLEGQPRRPVTSICVNEGKLYAGGRDGAIAEWDLASGLLTRTLAPGHSKGVTSICTSGSRLFSASEDGSVMVWNLTSGLCTRTIRGHDGYVTAVCVSPEGRLYSGGADRMINEWDAQTGRRQWILTGHTRWVLTLCAAAGRLYSGGNDHTVRVWDMATGRCLMVLEEHTDWVFSLCLGRDLLYSSSRDGTVRVWDTGSGQCLRTLKGHDGAGVRAVCVAAGRLYSGGDDKAIVEWDVKSGKPTRTLGGHFGAVSSLCAGHDGKLYSGSGDCTVKVWEIVSMMNPMTPPMSPMQGDDRYNEGPVTSTQNNHDRGIPNTPSRMNSVADQHYNTYANSPSQSQQPPPPPSQTPQPSSNEDTETIREQLAKAQELLAKQNRLKFRLKAELTTARTELASAKAELATSQDAMGRLREVEEELAAAKELLVTYKMELNLTQEAHLWALDYIIKQADSHFLEIELEMASVRHLLESPWTPLHHDDGGEAGLEQFMPPKVFRRTWDEDSDWDSDVEVPEDLAWWRKGSKKGEAGGTSPDGEGDSDNDENAGDALLSPTERFKKMKRPRSFVNRSIKETVEALRRQAAANGKAGEFGGVNGGFAGRARATLTEEPEEADGDDEFGNHELAANTKWNSASARRRTSASAQDYRQHTGMRGNGNSARVQQMPQQLFDEEDLVPDSAQMTPTAEDIFTSDDETTAESALWNGPVKSRSANQNRGGDILSPSNLDPSLSWHAEDPNVGVASWNSPASAPTMEAAAALWTGPTIIKKKTSHESVDERTGGSGDIVTDEVQVPMELGEGTSGLWTGPVKKKKNTPSVVDDKALADAEAVVWTGRVRSTSSAAPVQQQGDDQGSMVSGYSLADAESVVWSGKVKSKRSSAMRLDDAAASAGIMSTSPSNHSATSSGVKAKLAKRATVSEGLGPLETGKSAMAAPAAEGYTVGKDMKVAGFGDHAVVPKTSPVRSQSVFGQIGVGLAGPNGGVGAQPAASPSSWFRPLRSWVESIGEQLVVAPPPQVPQPPSQRRESTTGGVGSALAGQRDREDDRERARRELRERDEAARRNVAEALLRSDGGDDKDNSVTLRASGPSPPPSTRRTQVLLFDPLVQTTTTDVASPPASSVNEAGQAAEPYSITTGFLQLPMTTPSATQQTPPMPPAINTLTSTRHQALSREIDSPIPTLTPSSSYASTSGILSSASPNHVALSSSSRSRSPPITVPSSPTLSEDQNTPTEQAKQPDPYHNLINVESNPIMRRVTVSSVNNTPATTPPRPISAPTIASTPSPRQVSRSQTTPLSKQVLLNQDIDSPSNALERMATAFENVLETAIENPLSLLPGWLRNGTGKESGNHADNGGVGVIGSGLKRANTVTGGEGRV